MNVRWSEQALKSLIVIFDHVADDSAVAACKLISVLTDDTEALLKSSPLVGRPGRVAGTREWIAHKNYIVVYQVAESMVYILDVRHVAKQWPSTFV